MIAVTIWEAITSLMQYFKQKRARLVKISPKSELMKRNSITDRLPISKVETDRISQPMDSPKGRGQKLLANKKSVRSLALGDSPLRKPLSKDLRTIGSRINLLVLNDKMPSKKV